MPLSRGEMSNLSSSLSSQFTIKKQAILSQLADDPKDYEDKSPKGSVDVQILDLIRLINGLNDWVTTSSCSGRVAVFVEGPKKLVPSKQSIADDHQQLDSSNGENEDTNFSQSQPQGRRTGTTNAAPGGKGGGHWLYVSHDPLNGPANEDWTKTFDLSRSGPQTPASSQSQRLVHLSFSPLILHVLCASLHHARPLLSAAINAGFRESGVQSLKALDPNYAGDGVMVAIRTNGIVFETIVGVWNEEEQKAVALVGEPYLRMCADVVNERFAWNDERKERLFSELRQVIQREGWSEDSKRAETKDERRERKRREGLERQQAAKGDQDGVQSRTNSLSTATEDINLEALDAS